MLSSVIAVAAAAVSVSGGATTFTPAADLPLSIKTTTFPITKGTIQPDTAAGRLVHSGKLRLTYQGSRLTLKRPVVRIGKRSRVTVQVAGSRVKAFELDPTDADFGRDGLGNTIDGVEVLLTRAGARALNQTFGVTAFQRFAKVGTLDIAARSAQIAFAGGRTDLALDPGTASALTSLGVVLAPLSPATANDDGSIGFPITGGRVAAKTLAGRIRHSGGLTLSKGETQVALRNFAVNTRTGTLAAQVGNGPRVDILSLDLGAAEVAVDGLEVTASGITATLTQAAADALNAAFATTAFSEGLTLGTATVRGEAA